MFREVEPLEVNLLWFYVIVMAIGAVSFYWLNRKNTKIPRMEYLIAIMIVVWSGTMYALMAVGQGQLQVGDRIIFFARYLDWVVTTPLLLLALAFTAMHYIKKRITLILALVSADVLMIVSGLIADFSEGNVKYSWYLIGCLALLVIFYLVWGPLRKIAKKQSSELYMSFKVLAGYLSVLWLGYPTVWLLGPSGLNQLQQSTDVALFVFLPIFSKVGFSLLDLYLLRRLYDQTHRKPYPID